MATLTEVSFYTRRVIKGTVIIIILLMITPVVIRIGKTIYKRLNPEPPPPPTVKYGKLPVLRFPPAPSRENPKFKLETIQGSLPKMPEQGNVYVVGFNQSRLLEFQRVKDRAAKMGFPGEPITTDELTYTWVDSGRISSLVVNIVSGKWSYSYNWRTDPTLLIPQEVPAANRATDKARGFLGQMSALAKDVIGGEVKVKYLIASPDGETREAPSFSEANFVRVDIFRAAIGDVPFVTAGGETSPINVVMNSTKEKGKPNIVQANYNYSVGVEGESATYPLKPIEQAWSELTKGEGYLTKYLPEVTVRKIHLAYYESDEPQEFIQPVYVFSGDSGFMGYVPAVADEFIQNST